jgi:uncharacterized membrane protein YccC
MSDDADALIAAISAIAAAAVLWNRIQQARIARRLQRLFDEQEIVIDSVDTATKNEPAQE